MSALFALLAQNGGLSQTHLDAATAHQADKNTTAPQALLAVGAFTGKDLAKALSEIFSMVVENSQIFNFDACCRSLNLRDLVMRYRVLPLMVQGNLLHLGVSDPTNQEGCDEFRFKTGLSIEPVLLTCDQIDSAIRKVYGQDLGESSSQSQDITDDDLADLVTIDERESTSEVFDLSQDTAPVSRYINQMLQDAVRKKASDIHFEPYETFYRVRFRCDGILHQHAQPPSHLSRRLSTRLKVMSKLNIAERRKPQDGRIKIKISAQVSVDLRVSCLPTLWGEKIVLRILDGGSATLDIEVLGYNPSQQKQYLNALAKPQGMILITGPTGSGKTVSLYTGLKRLNTDERNISTAEDPVEINLEGVNQVQINAAVGLSFADALRSFLRQDPDVVMVGEIRDIETAAIAVKAAQTGHLVLSTLHTNSAAETLTRLLNMGVEDFNLASSLSLIIAQRLARRLCNRCKEPHIMALDLRTKWGFPPDVQFYKASEFGCDDCNQGYIGRVGIYEVMPFTKPLATALLAGENTLELEEKAKQEGMKTLIDSGIEKVCEGITSLSELQRVLHTD
jgi:type IV pilus assembly protein PilB